uniref:Transmembrane protein n=1 Tax=Panagrellus redivivus TaxID=6233 RepID=A0A7E4VMH0_PANRE
MNCFTSGINANLKFARACCPQARAMPSVVVLMTHIVMMCLLTAAPLFFGTVFVEASVDKSEDYTTLAKFNIEPSSRKDIDACRGFGFVCTDNPVHF